MRATSPKPSRSSRLLRRTIPLLVVVALALGGCSGGHDTRPEDSEELLSPSALRLTWEEKAELSYALTINRKGGLSTEVLRRASVG